MFEEKGLFISFDKKEVGPASSLKIVKLLTNSLGLLGRRAFSTYYLFGIWEGFD